MRRRQIYEQRAEDLKELHMHQAVQQAVAGAIKKVFPDEEEQKVAAIFNEIKRKRKKT